MSDTIVGPAIRASKFLIEMKKRDLLLLGFIILFFLSIGVLTGYVPSPVLTVMAQHEAMMKQNTTLVEIAKLQLYLARENCLHTARTETERSRCDRQSIRAAILDDVLPTDSPSKQTIPASDL